MRATARLLSQLPLRLTLFTHDHCSLCVPVKEAMSRVWDRRHFEYREVDVLDPKNSKWKTLYEFDIPVVHVDRTAALTSTDDGETTAAARKLKHRLTEAELEKVMDEVEKS
ncbi:hypothetical protein PRZ48_002325 [Zasmidium cellare]|uniref:Glutaredoxin-like protein n=1 Tax=Zasmidium cellare TaxID=395010 RepID=A0ABR0F5P2_ZASCE|nr:hypothetical protein PRZ48_002325 [Zasmidium cellare]